MTNRTGRWAQRRMDIDRDGDWYEETMNELGTGEFSIAALRNSATIPAIALQGHRLTPNALKGQTLAGPNLAT